MVENGGRRTFVRSAIVAARYPIVFVPALVLGIAGALVSASLDSAVGALGSSFLTRFVVDFANVVVTIAGVTATAGLADAAWLGGPVTLSDARRGFAGRASGTALAVLGATAVAAFLSPLTLGLSYFADVFFLLYAIPAAAVAKLAPGDALRESITIGLARLAPTILVVACLIIIRAAMVVIAIVLSGVPFVGTFLESVVLELVAAYVTVMLVGDYRALRNLDGRSGSPS